MHTFRYYYNGWLSEVTFWSSTMEPHPEPQKKPTLGTLHSSRAGTRVSWENTGFVGRPQTLMRQIWAWILVLTFIALIHRGSLTWVWFPSSYVSFEESAQHNTWFVHLPRASYLLSLLSAQPKYPPSHSLALRLPPQCAWPPYSFLQVDTHSIHTLWEGKACRQSCLVLVASAWKPLTHLHFRMDFLPFCCWAGAWGCRQRKEVRKEQIGRWGKGSGSPRAVLAIARTPVPTSTMAAPPQPSTEHCERSCAVAPAALGLLLSGSARRHHYFHCYSTTMVLLPACSHYIDCQLVLSDGPSPVTVLALCPVYTHSAIKAFHVETYWIFVSTLWLRYSYCPHFKQEGTGVQRSHKICLRPHS